MISPGTPTKGVLAAFALAVVCLSICLEVRGQQTALPGAADDLSRGIGLYEQGDKRGATDAFRDAVKKDKSNAEAWYYLGLALKATGDVKGGRKALETAIKLKPDFADAHAALAATFLLLSDKESEAEREAKFTLALNPQSFEAHYILAVLRLRAQNASAALEEINAALSTQPGFAKAWLLKSDVLKEIYAVEIRTPKEPFPARRLIIAEMSESLNEYLKLQPDARDADTVKYRLKGLQSYLAATEKTQDATALEDKVFDGKDVTTRAVMLIRPEPQYTEEARGAQARGTVVLRAVFGANGQVREIEVLRSLEHGLNETSIKAARSIVFIPATKDGYP
ncbi:MAG TPA: TonB family protein, partial [Pyrinomonadaceae bacterium]|nr:TonB family protein [Pyrinomonadaceae bacterium]